jgi:hypothetical protein
LCVYIYGFVFFLVDGLIDTGSSLFMQQDEWVVCRVFQKSAGAKKFPSNQPRAVLNPYNLEMAPTHVVPSPMMQLGDPTQFHGGRNYMSNAELAELARVFRGGGGGGGIHECQPPADATPAELSTRRRMLYNIRAKFESRRGRGRATTGFTSHGSGTDSSSSNASTRSCQSLHDDWRDLRLWHGNESCKPSWE